jgi:hypothetical protein
VSADIEFVYTWPDGSEEVRYRRPENSHAAMNLINEVLELRKKHGTACPYSYRIVPSERKQQKGGS